MTREVKQLWAGTPLVYGSAAVHLAAVAATIARPPLWPWTLGAVALDHLLIGEIVRTGCLAAWQPGPLAQCDEERRIWRFLQARGAGRPPLYLGYGREDRFAQGLDLMAQALPPAAVMVIEGGHDWSTWSALWERFLDLRWT